jgi:hypothetical protein
MKKFLKYFGVVLLILVAAGAVLFLIYNEPLPEGKQGNEATELKAKMASAINYDAWENTRFVHWKFKNIHEFWWDRKAKVVRVKWEKTEVYFHTPSGEGTALRSGGELEGEEKDEVLKTAIAYFNNDSFWLNGPAKSIAAASSFSKVETEEGPGLLATFESGGTTPGDSYLWILDEDGLPKSCKLWVSVIPVGGVKSNITRWQTLDTGAKIPAEQQIGPMTVEINELSSASLDMPQNLRFKNIFGGQNLNDKDYE